MAVTVEMQNTGDADANADVVASVEHALADRPGDWHVVIVGSQANDRWEMKITGLQGRPEPFCNFLKSHSYD